MLLRNTRPTVLSIAGLTAAGILIACIAGPASAAPAASSRDSVRTAKTAADTGSVAAELTARLNALQDAADAAAVSEQQAGQAYAVTVGNQQDAADRAHTLAIHAATARSTAATSAREAAAFTVGMTRTGGPSGVTTTLLTSPGTADDTLYRVSTASRLTEHAADTLATAQADERTAAALQREAAAANTALVSARHTAERTLATATVKATTAQTAIETQQRKQQTVLEQLAHLNGSTVDAETRNWQAQRATAAEAALPTPSQAPSRANSKPVITPPSNPPTVATPPAAATPPGKPAPSPTTPQPPAPGPKPVPSPSQPTPQPTPPKPTPAPPAPTLSKATQVLTFARAQVGKPYVFAASGPNAYDCSGLVMAAYSSVGVDTGGHNVVWQYNHFKAAGRLVPLAQRQPGDILFYSTDGTAAGGYHNGIYSGNGKMVEAANTRVGVIERAVWWPQQLLPYVARPTGSL